MTPPSALDRLVAPSRRSPPVVETDDRAARRSFQNQIARLDRELAATVTLQAAVDPLQTGGTSAVARPRAVGGRLLSLGELEAARDALSIELRDARATAATRSAGHEQAHRLLARMLAEPGRYKFARITRAELGEQGCGAWEVRPRLGIIGMLAGWWEVKHSSGCPLPRRPVAQGARARHRALARRCALSVTVQGRVGRWRLALALRQFSVTSSVGSQPGSESASASAIAIG